MSNVVPLAGPCDRCPAWCVRSHDSSDLLDKTPLRSRQMPFRVTNTLTESGYGFVGLMQPAGSAQPLVHIDLPKDEAGASLMIPLDDADDLSRALHHIVRRAAHAGDRTPDRALMRHQQRGHVGGLIAVEKHSTDL